MKFSIPTKNKTTTIETWGMGFLLIFFPEEHHQDQEIGNKSPNFSNPLFQSLFRTQILHRAQSTISICLLLLFTTALLFTLSTFPSSAATGGGGRLRRQMLQELVYRPNCNLSHALQRMGALYRRGTRAMNDVVVAHAPDAVTEHDLRLFVRLFLRSSLAARSDLVLLLPARTAALDAAILRENDSFVKLLARYGRNSKNDSSIPHGFDFEHFLKVSRKESGEPIWGRRSRANSSAGAESESKPSYGSVVAFDADELDPENSLSGFLENVPMNLRRWACYPMLLGRVRRNFKHVMLVDVKEVLLLGDPLGRVRSLTPESVLLHHFGKHGKKNPDRTRSKSVYTGIVMGGSRGIRRLSSEMLTGIVRSSIQRNKRKNPVTEPALFSQLIENDFVLRNVNLVIAPEPVLELGPHIGSGLKLGMRNSGMIRKGNSNLDFYSVVMKHICKFTIDSTVYSDC